MNKLGFCVLSFSLSTVAGGAISTTLAALYIPPAGGVVRDAFGPRKPGTTPMPAPASTEHYAGSSNGLVA